MESVVLFSALVGIMVISGASVMSLNPRLAKKDPEVAGVNTFSNNSDLDFKLNNSGINFSLEEKNHTISVRINRLNRGFNEFNIGSISNLNDISDNNVKVETTVNGIVLEDIKVSIFDSINNYTLYSADENAVDTNINFLPSENKNLSLQINSEEKINFPFEIILEIK